MRPILIGLGPRLWRASVRTGCCPRSSGHEFSKYLLRRKGNFLHTYIMTFGHPLKPFFPVSLPYFHVFFFLYPLRLVRVACLCIGEGIYWNMGNVSTTPLKVTPPSSDLSRPIVPLGGWSLLSPSPTPV